MKKFLVLVTLGGILTISQTADAAPESRLIMATYQDLEAPAGRLVFDSDLAIEAFTGETFFALTLLEFTSPATGAFYTLADASGLNDIPAFTDDDPDQPASGLVAHVIATVGPTGQSVGILPLRQFGPQGYRSLILSPYRESDGTMRAWRETSQLGEAAAGTYRLAVPEGSSVQLGLMALATLLPCRRVRKGDIPE